MKKVCGRAASQWRVVEVAVGTSRALDAELSAGCSRPRRPYTCAVCNRTCPGTPPAELSKQSLRGTTQGMRVAHVGTLFSILQRTVECAPR